MDTDTLRTWHRQAVEAGLAEPDARRWLLAGLGDGLVATIPRGSSPADQLWLDLQVLAERGAGLDAPLTVWLRNAAHRLADRPQGRFFERQIERVAVGDAAQRALGGPYALRFEPPARRFVAAHPQGALLERCTLGLQWPLRARLWRRSDGTRFLAVVSVLARDAGKRALLDAALDGTLVVQCTEDTVQSSAHASGFYRQTIFDRPELAAAAVQRYFGGESTT